MPTSIFFFTWWHCIKRKNVTFVFLDIKLFLYVLIPIKRKHHSNISWEQCMRVWMEACKCCLPSFNHLHRHAEGNEGRQKPFYRVSGAPCNQHADPSERGRAPSCSFIPRWAWGCWTTPSRIPAHLSSGHTCTHALILPLLVGLIDVHSLH